MATRSTITLHTPEGYDSIYCHWDGHTSDVGHTLKTHYNTLSRVKALIALGSLSSLCKNLEPEDGVSHSFDHPASEVTVAYHRDRGEGSKPDILKFETLLEVATHGEEYNYVFQDDEWCLAVKKSNVAFLVPYNTKD